MKDLFAERRWIAAATEQAILAEVEPSLILGGCRRHKVARARWAAFKKVLDEHPRMAIKRLADAAGYDHTTVMHGIRRISGASVDQVRKSKATGRVPATIQMMQAAE